MRLNLILLTTALTFGLGTAAVLAEDAPGAKSDITIATDQSDSTINKGAADTGAANESAGASEDSAAPDANGDSNTSPDDQGSSAPEGSKM